MDRAEIERKIMNETVVEKTWQIPAHGDKGAVTIALRMPEVTITDSQGQVHRHRTRAGRCRECPDGEHRRLDR